MKSKLLFIILAFLLTTLNLIGCDENLISPEYYLLSKTELPEIPIIVRPNFSIDPSEYFIAQEGARVILQVIAEDSLSLVFTGFQPLFKYKSFSSFNKNILVIIGKLTSEYVTVKACRQELCSKASTVNFIFAPEELDSLANGFLKKYWLRLSGENDYAKYYNLPIVLINKTNFISAESFQSVINILNAMYDNLSFTSANTDSALISSRIVIKKGDGCYTYQPFHISAGKRKYLVFAEVFLAEYCTNINGSVELALIHELHHALGWFRGTGNPSESHLNGTFVGIQMDSYFPPFVLYAIDSLYKSK